MGLAILRVTVGVVFLAHGLQKAVVWGPLGGVPFFRDVGIPLALVAAPLVTVVETLAGAALILGYRTRVAAALVGIVALTALASVHLPHGFFLPNGIEFVLVLTAASATLVLGGPGALALDRHHRAGSEAPPPHHPTA